MVQARKKNKVDIHKNELNNTRNEVLTKRKPSLHITFHNPNSDETMTSYLTKILGERLADEIRKEPCT